MKKGKARRSRSRDKDNDSDLYKKVLSEAGYKQAYQEICTNFLLSLKYNDKKQYDKIKAVLKKNTRKNRFKNSIKIWRRIV